MIITCIGHAQFLIELDDGMRIVTDPYDDACGYPVVPTCADVVLVSHGHHDHCAVETVKGYTQVIDWAGQHTLSPGVKVTAIQADHDAEGGRQRGKTLLFLLEAEGLRIVHLGDLGHLPTRKQELALAPADVLMIPVGGHYTIDAAMARETAGRLQARVILPMHYRTRANADWPIAPVEDFTRQHGRCETVDLLRITRDDLDCQPALAVLKPQSLEKEV